MPTKKRASVGTKRPKKKVTFQEKQAVEESDDSDKLEDVSSAPELSPVESSISALSLTVDESQEPPAQEPEEEPEVEQRELKKRAVKALRALLVVNRRWRKTILTHFNEKPEYRWLFDSEVFKRVLERMRLVDAEHAAAERHYVNCHREAVLVATLAKFTKQAELHPEDDRLAYFAIRADAKLLLFRSRMDREKRRPLSIREPKCVMDHGKQLELLCKHAGIAEAYQWVHLSELI